MASLHTLPSRRSISWALTVNLSSLAICRVLGAGCTLSCSDLYKSVVVVGHPLEVTRLGLAALILSIAAFTAISATLVVLAYIAARSYLLTIGQRTMAGGLYSTLMGFVRFLITALVNFIVALNVLMFGPLVYVTKLALSPAPRKFKSVLITGGNSGMGKHLALRYAEEPGMHLVLVARDEARLKDVAQKCRDKGADVTACAADVQDGDSIDRVISQADARYPLDLVIANAGIASTDKSFTPKLANHIIDVNVKGVFNTVLPAMARMKSRGKGQIALMSSVAGIMPTPSLAEYSASKFAVEAFGESIRPHMAKHGVGVTNICPGFVRSRMTEGMVRDINQLHEDMLMPTEDAASIIVEGIACDAPNIIFPFARAVVSSAFQVLPMEMRDVVFKGLLWTSNTATKLNVPYLPEALMPVVGLDRTPLLADAA